MAEMYLKMFPDLTFLKQPFDEKGILPPLHPFTKTEGVSPPLLPVPAPLYISNAHCFLLELLLFIVLLYVAL